MLRFIITLLWGAVVCGLVAAVFLLVSDLDSLKPQIEARTSALLQEKVHIGGDMRPGFLEGHPALVMHNVDVGTDLKADAVSLALLSSRPIQKFFMHADGLTFKGRLLGNYDIPVTVLQTGFEISPLKGELDGAALTGKIKYNDKKLHIDAILKNYPLGKVAEEAEGTVDGKLQLDGKGENSDQLIHTLTGRVMLTSGAGKLTSKSLNFWSRGLISSLLPGQKNETALNCSIVDFDIGSGIAHSRAVVVDTSENTVFAKGSIDLDKWQVDMVLKPNPKDMSLVSLATPVHVTGPLDNATVTPEVDGMAKKIGGMLLGVVNPALALIPILTSGMDEYTGSCADILKQYQPKKSL